MKSTKTFLQLYAEKLALYEKTRNVVVAIDDLPGGYFLTKAHDMYEISVPTRSFADCLVEELLERDYPMNREWVESVFKASGFPYTQDHVTACRPDSQKTIDEEESYWRGNQ